MKYLDQGGQFGGVTDLGTGAMCLDQAERIGRDTGRQVGTLKRQFLPAGARRIDRAAAAVAGRADALDHRVNAVASTLGVSQTFEHQNADAFAQHRAIAVGVERLGITGGGQCRGLGKTHVHEDVVEGIHAAGDHHVRQAGRQFQRSQMNCRQRARTSGIDHTVGAAQVKAIGNAPCRHIAEQAWKRVLLPADIGVGDALHHILGDIRFNARVFQRAAPVWMTETRAERNHQFESAGDAEDHAGAVAVKCAVLRSIGGTTRTLPGAGRIARVGQRALRRDQTQ